MTWRSESICCVYWLKWRSRQVSESSPRDSQSDLRGGNVDTAVTIFIAHAAPVADRHEMTMPKGRSRDSKQINHSAKVYGTRFSWLRIVKREITQCFIICMCTWNDRFLIKMKVFGKEDRFKLARKFGNIDPKNNL